MATVMTTLISVTQPLCEDTKEILKRQLKINDDTLGRYLESFDSLLLKNLRLNHFLKNTAILFIQREDADIDIDIILATVQLAKRFKFEHADQQLREEFRNLRTEIENLAVSCCQ